MRSGIGGWVENSLETSCGRNGLAIIMWLALTMSRCGASGARAVPDSSLRSAEASASGSPVRVAPSSSASYSRVRLIAIWIVIAAIGASSDIASSAIGLGRSSSLLPPPNMLVNISIWATLVMTPAIAAATEAVRMSRL